MNKVAGSEIRQVSRQFALALKSTGTSFRLLIELIRIPVNEGGLEVMQAATELLKKGVKEEDILPTLERMGIFSPDMMRPLNEEK